MNLYTAEVVSKKDLAPNILELHTRLLEPAEMNFKAGQCLGFHLVIDTKKRLYSISSAPVSDKELEFCVDYSPMGDGSKYILNLKPGDTVKLEGPYGGFIADIATPKDILFIATGVGVAPFKSLILDLLSKGFKNKITLLWGNRHEENNFWHEVFTDLAQKYPNFKFIPTLSQPKGEWSGFQGRVTKYLEENAATHSNDQAYVCGSPQMVKDVRALLISQGFTPRDIKIEIFT